jgi:hypothetical protein
MPSTAYCGMLRQRKGVHLASRLIAEIQILGVSFDVNSSKSMELNSTGTIRLEFPLLKESYTWGKVTTTMRNLFSSTSRYLEHHGSLVIKNETLGFVCQLNFKESGYFSSSQNEIIGEIKDPKGKKICNLNGRWNHSLNYFTDESPDSMNVIWRARSFPPNFRENYGFTQFAMELNELTGDLENIIPNTDTRLRPDQRYFFS